MSSLLLLSGGVDSAAICYWVRPQTALTIDYGQRAAEAEIDASAAICRAVGIRHSIARADCSAFGAGIMWSATEAQPKQIDKAPTPEWWPFRNQLLITLGAAFALRIGACELIIGTVAEDCRHRDGSASFINAASALLDLQEGSVKLIAPAIQTKSAELIRRSRIPREILAWSHSCHTGNHACGSCPGCSKRTRIMEDLNS